MSVAGAPANNIFRSLLKLASKRRPSPSSKHLRADSAELDREHNTCAGVDGRRRHVTETAERAYLTPSRLYLTLHPSDAIPSTLSAPTFLSSRATCGQRQSFFHHGRPRLERNSRVPHRSVQVVLNCERFERPISGRRPEPESVEFSGFSIPGAEIQTDGFKLWCTGCFSHLGVCILGFRVSRGMEGW